MSLYKYMVFRPEGPNPSRQYNFSNWDEYITWRKRHPYRNETIKVITFWNDRQINEEYDYPDGYILPF